METKQTEDFNFLYSMAHYLMQNSYLREWTTENCREAAERLQGIAARLLPAEQVRAAWLEQPGCEWSKDPTYEAKACLVESDLDDTPETCEILPEGAGFIATIYKNGMTVDRFHLDYNQIASMVLRDRGEPIGTDPGTAREIHAALTAPADQGQAAPQQVYRCSVCNRTSSPLDIGDASRATDGRDRRIIR